MVHKFTVNCDYSGQKVPVTLYVGNPSIGNHPLNFQNRWLGDNKGVSVPSNIMKSFEDLIKVADKNAVSFDELCKYVVDELNSRNSLAKDAARASEFSDAAAIKKKDDDNGGKK